MIHILIGLACVAVLLYSGVKVFGALHEAKEQVARPPVDIDRMTHWRRELGTDEGDDVA